MALFQIESFAFYNLTNIDKHNTINIRKLINASQTLGWIDVNTVFCRTCNSTDFVLSLMQWS